MTRANKKIFSVGYGNVKKVNIGNNHPLVFIGGPCAIESKKHTFKMASKIKKICKKLKIDFIEYHLRAIVTEKGLKKIKSFYK